MNGPEHYQKAEQLLTQVQNGRAADGTPIDDINARDYLVRAQVHATLAQAAAIALNAMVIDENKGAASFDGDMEHWRCALDGTEPQP